MTISDGTESYLDGFLGLLGRIWQTFRLVMFLPFSLRRLSLFTYKQSDKLIKPRPFAIFASIALILTEAAFAELWSSDRGTLQNALKVYQISSFEDSLFKSLVVLLWMAVAACFVRKLVLRRRSPEFAQAAYDLTFYALSGFVVWFLITAILLGYINNRKEVPRYVSLAAQIGLWLSFILPTLSLVVILEKLAGYSRNYFLRIIRWPFQILGAFGTVLAVPFAAVVPILVTEALTDNPPLVHLHLLGYRMTGYGSLSRKDSDPLHVQQQLPGLRLEVAIRNLSSEVMGFPLKEISLYGVDSSSSIYLLPDEPEGESEVFIAPGEVKVFRFKLPDWEFSEFTEAWVSNSPRDFALKTQIRVNRKLLPKEWGLSFHCDRKDVNDDPYILKDIESADFDVHDPTSAPSRVSLN